jgi:precorrin-6B methylase 1
MSVVSLLRQNFEIEWRQQDCIEKIKQAKHHSNRRIIAFEDPKFKPGKIKRKLSNIHSFPLAQQVAENLLPLKCGKH